MIDLLNTSTISKEFRYGSVYNSGSIALNYRVNSISSIGEFHIRIGKQHIQAETVEDLNRRIEDMISVLSKMKIDAQSMKDNAVQELAALDKARNYD